VKIRGLTRGWFSGQREDRLALDFFLAFLLNQDDGTDLFMGPSLRIKQLGTVLFPKYDFRTKVCFKTFVLICI